MTARNSKKFGCVALAKNLRSKNNNEVQFQTPHYEYPKKWEKPVVTYAVIRGTEDLPGDSMEVLAMNLAMTTWDFEIPLTMKVVKKTEKPDITLEFQDSENDKFLKKNDNVLAYAYFPGTEKEGTIVFNDEHLWSLHGEPIPAPYDPSGKTKMKTYNLLHTLIHEIGHSLGLSHSHGISYKDTVMYPYYNGQLDLDEYDIQRITEKYGSRQWPHPIHYIRMKNWLKHRIRRFEISRETEKLEFQALKNDLEIAREKIKKKDAIIEEQMKVIMDLVKRKRVTESID